MSKPTLESRYQLVYYWGMVRAKTSRLKRLSKRKKVLLTALVVLVLLAIGGYFLVGRPAQALYQQAKLAKPHLANLKTGLITQNLPQIRAEVAELDQIRAKSAEIYQQFGWLEVIPGVGNYYRDGQHVFRAGEAGIEAAQIMVTALEPFEDFEDIEKLTQLVVISPQIIPQLEEALQKIAVVRAEITQINPQRYPTEIKGFKIRSNLESAIAALDSAEGLLTDAGPLLRALPQALGAEEPQNYLILFQNDKELRPGGGFITAYALAQFNQGVFSVLQSDDIYNLDQNRVRLPAPDPITRFLKVPGFYMRDTNFSPDFKKSMEDFLIYYDACGAPPVAGIIAIDTQFVESFLELTGPISVPEYQQDFSGWPNLPQSCRTGGTDFTTENVVCRLELYAEKILHGSSQRKALIGDLMGHLVDWLLTAPPNIWPPILKNVVEQAQTKHLLVYFENETLQKLAEDYNLAGRLREDFKTDFLHVNDANLAGAKSDLYMDRKYRLEVKTTGDGQVINKLTLTYANTGLYDGWLNTTNRDYLRIYVPQGSMLIDSDGGSYETTTFEDLGKTVFDNFLQTPPLQTIQFMVEYQLPPEVERKSSKEYELLIQKQPGKGAEEWTVVVNGEEQTINLDRDEKLRFEL